LFKNVINFNGYFSIETVILCIFLVLAKTEFYQEVQEDTHKGTNY